MSSPEELTGVEEKLRRRAKWAEAEMERQRDLCVAHVASEQQLKDRLDAHRLLLRNEVATRVQAEAKLAKVVEAGDAMWGAVALVDAGEHEVRAVVQVEDWRLATAQWARLRGVGSLHSRTALASAEGKPSA